MWRTPTGIELNWSTPTTVQARLEGQAEPTATANILPDAGPTSAYFRTSRARWLAGEKVTPVGLAVGTIALHGETHDVLTEVLGEMDDYTILHNEWEDTPEAEEGLGGYKEITRLVHTIVREAAIEHAHRRGVRNPFVQDWETLGGVYIKTDRKHVDYSSAHTPVGRYVATPVGWSTGLDTDPIGRDDVDAVGFVHRPGRLFGSRLPVNGVADILLFEGHTPHEPPSQDCVRLFTSLDIAEG